MAMKFTRIMLVISVLGIVASATVVKADDSLRRFTQQTLDGNTIKSETLKGMPLVINFLGPE